MQMPCAPIFLEALIVTVKQDLLVMGLIAVVSQYISFSISVLE